MRAAVAFFVLVVAAASARADELNVSIENPKVLVGKGVPTLVLGVERATQKLTVELQGTTGEQLKRDLGAVKAGRTLRIPLREKPGRGTLTGKVSVEFAGGGGGELPLSLDVALIEPLRVDVDKTRLDLAKGFVPLVTSAPVERCEFDALLDGETTRQGGVPVHDNAVSVPFDGRDVLLRLTLTCYDADGFFAGVHLYPWKLEVPHEEVNFATGDSRIQASELPKVERAFDDIMAAVRRYGALIKIKLYVIGHTDSVGDSAANDALSLARARSIAAQLKKKGVKVPVFAAGFGEGSLLVETPDETDEPKNRRAQYILAVDPPYAVSWQTL